MWQYPIYKLFFQEVDDILKQLEKMEELYQQTKNLKFQAYNERKMLIQFIG